MDVMQDMESPTTGTFPLQSFSFQSTAATASLDIVKNEDGSCSSFAFKPLAGSNPSSDMQPLGNLVIIMHLFASGFLETQNLVAV